MKKTAIFGIVALLLVGLAAAGVFATSFGGFGKKRILGEERLFCYNCTMPFDGFSKIGIFGDNDAIKEAIENGNYEAYMAALEESWKAFKAEITEEEFNKMVEQHKNMLQKMTEMQSAREKVQKALDDGDYNAWKEAIKGSPQEERLAKVITEDNFDTYVKMQQAMQNRDFEGVNELAKELGLERPAKDHGFGIGRSRNSMPLG